MSRVRLLSDLGLRDMVMTPTGRFALVKGFDHDGVVIQFQDDAEECTLLPHLLQLVTRARPRPFPSTFFPRHAPA